MKRSKLLILCGMMLLCFTGCAAESKQPQSSQAGAPAAHMTELTLPKQLTESELIDRGIQFTYTVGPLGKRIEDIEGDFTGKPVETEEDAMQAIAAISDLLGCKDVYDELRLYTVTTNSGLTHYYFQQNYNGIPINSHRTNLHVRDESHRIIDLQNSYFPAIELNTVPDISAKDAQKTAEKAVPDRKFNKKPQLEITVNGDAAFLIWAFESDDGGTARIDAHTGEVLYAFNGEIGD